MGPSGTATLHGSHREGEIASEGATMKRVGRFPCALVALLFPAALAVTSAWGQEQLPELWPDEEVVEEVEIGSEAVLEEGEFESDEVIVEEVEIGSDEVIVEEVEIGSDEVIVEEVEVGSDELMLEEFEPESDEAVVEEVERAPESAQLVDGIAAQVGSDIVLVSDVRNLVGPMEARFKGAGASGAELAAVRADGLERLIERALIRQVVRQSELEATEIEVDAAIAAIAEENDLSMEQLIATVEAEGLPYEVYRERIRGEIEQSKVLQGMVASRVRLEETDVQAAYDERFENQPAGGIEVHLRHVVVPYESDDLTERSGVCLIAEKARARLARGDAFGEVLLDLPPLSAQGSRDLGWIHQALLASWMAPPVVRLEPGGVTEVISTDFGCNVIELVDRREFEPKTYDEVRNQLYDLLFAQKMQEEYLEFMEKLRKRTYIERKGIFADAARLGESQPAQGKRPTGLERDDL
jgi:peptidyl-prolyl cis-trans isomerase SurA